MNSGKQFESLVRQTLELSGLRVIGEHIIGHKKVDMYFEESRLGSQRRVAVECKDYAEHITVDEVSHIYSQYLPLYQSNKIDELLIITKAGLSPAAQTMIISTRDLLHLTLSELQNSLLDFRSYLLHLANQFIEDGLNKYYVKLCSADGDDLESWLLKWIGSNSSQPMAILGSYGMGKTTLARRMCHVLACSAQQDPTCRIPLFFKLGEIASEQSIEGLIGKSLTTGASVRNYNFEAFMTLNRSGRFVIFLDGFDEMKHSLSWDQFRYNFSQLNRLISTGSKVVLLGRPNAFLNEDEQNYALHGLRQFGSGQFRDEAWPDYQEIHLSLLSREQVVDFLERYVAFQTERQVHSSGFKPRSKWHLDNIIQQVSTKQFSDIARRPVQLRMLAEVLPQWKGSIEAMTVAILYDRFIDLVIERELEKQSRQMFGLKQRRLFARYLAWFLWQSKQAMSIQTEHIPVQIWDKFCDDETKLEAVQRDLLSACFLSTKQGGALYFPHRSFQEFLVAEAISEQFSEGTLELDTLDSLINSEVSIFLREIVGVSQIRRAEPAISKFRGLLKMQTVSIWTSNEPLHLYLLSVVKESNSPWWLLFLCVETVEKHYYACAPREIIDLALEKLKKATDPHYAVLCYFCILLSLSMIKEKDRPWQDWNTALIFLGSYTKKPHVGPPSRKIIVDLLQKLSVGKKTRVVDVRGQYHFIAEALATYAIVRDWTYESTLSIQGIILVETCTFDTEVAQQMRNL